MSLYLSNLHNNDLYSEKTAEAPMPAEAAVLLTTLNCPVLNRYNNELYPYIMCLSPNSRKGK